MIGQTLFTNEIYNPYAVINVTNKVTNSYKSNNYPLYAVLLSKYNYFMGMRITTKSTVLQNVTDSLSKGVFASSRI